MELADSLLFFFSGIKSNFNLSQRLFVLDLVMEVLLQKELNLRSGHKPCTMNCWVYGFHIKWFQQLFFLIFVKTSQTLQGSNIGCWNLAPSFSSVVAPWFSLFSPIFFFGTWWIPITSLRSRSTRAAMAAKRWSFASWGAAGKGGKYLNSATFPWGKLRLNDFSVKRFK